MCVIGSSRPALGRSVAGRALSSPQTETPCPPGRQVFHNSNSGISCRRKPDGFAFTHLDQISPEAAWLPGDGEGWVRMGQDGAGVGRRGNVTME